MILWLTLFIPWQVAYPEDSIEELDIAILVVFILDILLTFRTTFFNEENDEIIDAKIIFFHYLKSTNFLIDFVSAIPIGEIYQANDTKLTRIFSIIKIVRLARLGRLLKLLKNEELKLFS